MGNFAGTAIPHPTEEEFKEWVMLASGPQRGKRKRVESGRVRVSQASRYQRLIVNSSAKQAFYGLLCVAMLGCVPPDVWVQMCQRASQKKARRARRASLALSTHFKPAILVVVCAMVNGEPPRALSFEELRGLLASRETCPVTVAFVQQFPTASPLGA